MKKFKRKRKRVLLAKTETTHGVDPAPSGFDTLLKSCRMKQVRGAHPLSIGYYPRFAPLEKATEPVPMILFCPSCHTRHIDAAPWDRKLHHTHACQHCGFAWRPAVVATVGVEFLPGFKDGR